MRRSERTSVVARCPVACACVLGAEVSRFAPRSAYARPMSGDDEGDWIEVRRITDRIGAEMIRDFLEEHGVRVAIRGNPQATRMTWSQTSDLIRIVVAPGDVEKAHEALAAVTAGDAHPFRGGAPPDDEDERPERFVKPRSPLGAAFLAVIVPIGGGHFYARHSAFGTILACGIIGAVVGAVLTGRIELVRTWGLLVLVDAIGAVLAVRRFNEKRVPSDGVQRGWAIAAVLLAFATSAFEMEP